MSKEQRTLTMHPKLLLDVIQRQAGTLEKAVLEGVMNAIEAKANTVRISLKEKNNKAVLSIGDDGRGITTREEVELFFEQFGTPHEESENKIWAQFRMGRGQLFAFGKNVWRTGPFKMTVDVKNKGLDWLLEKNTRSKGCKIEVELYQNPIGYSYPSIASFKERIQELVRFVSIPVLFDGEQLNNDPKELEWTCQDKNAYYMFGVGEELKVYNLGVYVHSIPSYRSGVSGIVVSKKQLKVNFARNDVHSDCPIWQDMDKVVIKNRKKTRQQRRSLDKSERLSTLIDLRDGVEDYDEVKNIGLVHDVNGRVVTLEKIRKHKGAWTFAKHGDIIADKLMQQGQALCLDENLPEALGFTGNPGRLFYWLANAFAADWDLFQNWGHLEGCFKPFKELRKQFNSSYSILTSQCLTATEKRILAILNKMPCWKGREIHIGLSMTAYGWTDGETYIVIERSFLDGLNLNDSIGVGALFALLSHEMAHDINTAGSHTHGEEFFRGFHDMIMSVEAGDCRSASPLAWMSSFEYQIKRSRIEDRRVNERDKKQKQQARTNKKLGIAAKVK